MQASGLIATGFAGRGARWKRRGIGGMFFRARDLALLARFARLYDPEGNPIELWQPEGRDAQ